MNIQDLVAEVKALLPGAEKAKQLETQLATSATEITALNGKLSAKDTEIADLKGKLAAKDAEITKLNADHKTAIDAKEADVEKRANLKAAEIAAGKGITGAVKDEEKGGAGADGAGVSGGSKSLREQLAAIEDPKEAAAFYAKHREDLLAGK